MKGDPTRQPRARPEDVQRLYAYLRVNAIGRENAKTAREIGDALELGKHFDRLLRAFKHAANESGLLICADNTGYFIPANRDEASESIGRIRSQGAEMLALARTLEHLADSQFVQTATQIEML